MKILIVGFAKIKYMPYLNLYLDNLDCKKHEINLIYWNRDVMDEDLGSVKDIKLYEFKCYQEDEVSKTAKINNFLKFRKFVKTVLKEEFDFIIVLQTVPAVLLFDILVSKKFRGKYIYDYRDCTYEKINIYKYLVKKITENSYVTFVSSRGFKRYLPGSEKINYVNNILSEDVEFSEREDFFVNHSEKIRVGFWGLLREPEINLEIIKKISGSQLFELHYYGREQKTARSLKEYVLQNKIENVFFHGEYTPKDKYDFLKNTDIIHNVYSGENMLYAMSNKYYDGVVFNRAQMCMQGSYMGELAETCGIGCQVDVYSEKFIETLYDYFTDLNACELERNCRKEKERIVAENNKVEEIIKNI